MYDIIHILNDITHKMQVQGRKTHASTSNSTAYHHFTGKECLEVHLLKPARLDAHPEQSNVMSADDMQPVPEWLSICFSNPSRFSAGCLQNWQLGSAITMSMSWAYPPRAASSGLQGSWMLMIGVPSPGLYLQHSMPPTLQKTPKLNIYTKI